MKAGTFTVEKKIDASGWYCPAYTVTLCRINNPSFPHLPLCPDIVKLRDHTNHKDTVKNQPKRAN